MRSAVGILVVLGVMLVPWALWALLRSIWYRMRERRVLRLKYGDLKMFGARLEEWGLKPPSKDGRSEG